MNDPARPAGLVEGNRRVHEAGRDDGAAVGETRGDAGPASRARQDGIGLRLQVRPRRLGAKSQSGLIRKAFRNQSVTPSPATCHSCSADPAAATPLAVGGDRSSSRRGLTVWQIQRRNSASENPLADARFLQLTDFPGTEQAAALSRDGKFVAFLSDRDGRLDVWVTQVGTGKFYNLTKDAAREISNPSLRTLGFSPDGTLVTFWARSPSGPNQTSISVWGVPVLGGQPRPYLDGVAEYDWSSDGSRLVYHTTGPGDPTFVRDSAKATEARAIHTAPPGLHSHFPLWSPDLSFIYFVHGSVPDRLDIWRVAATGGTPERMTHHDSVVTHPVFLNAQTLLYLAARLGRLRSVDLQPRSRAAHFSPRQRRHRQVHLAGGKRRRQPARGDTDASREHALAHADHRRACRIVGRPSHSADNRKRIVSKAGRRLPALRLFKGHERQHLEAARRRGDRGLECA